MDYSNFIKSVMSGRFNMIDGMKEASEKLAKLPKKKLKKHIKEAEDLIRERSQDTFGYTVEYHDISHNPNLSDKEIRIALFDARQRYVRQFIDSHQGKCRWYREIREEEERRAKLAKLATTTDESEESEDKSESESEDESEDSDSD